MATQSKNAGLKKALREADDDTRAEILNGLPYQVGYAKTPAHTRFKKGNRGGPGRRRGSQNLHTVVREVFSQEIPVTKNGKRRKVPRREVIIEQIANKSCAGDLKAAAISIDLMSKTGELSAPQMAEFSAVGGQPSDALFRNLDLTRLSDSDKISLSRFAERIDAHGDMTVLSALEFECLKQIVNTARGENIPAACEPME